VFGLVSKYADYVPIYRQSAISERETGIDLSRATLNGWVMRVGELLQPITAAMGQELLSGSYIQADETTVGVQMHDGRGKNHQAYLWQYSRPGGPVVFDFRMGGNEKVPNGSWVTSRESCRVTATGHTTILVEQASCTLCMLGACQAKVLRCGQTQSQRRNLDSDRSANE
jgi:hypothetical protein